LPTLCARRARPQIVKRGFDLGAAVDVREERDIAFLADQSDESVGSGVEVCQRGGAGAAPTSTALVASLASWTLASSKGLMPSRPPATAVATSQRTNSCPSVAAVDVDFDNRMTRASQGIDEHIERFALRRSIAETDEEPIGAVMLNISEARR
jgi:hypothetical protein